MISSSKCWIDGAALGQLHQAARRPGMVLAVGLPDLHAGIGCPVGSAFVAAGVFYPDLIGTDIGCGIALWQSDLPAGKTGKIPRWADKLADLEEPWEGDANAWLAASGVSATGHEASLGTIGAGNHFAELQKVEEVLDPQRFAALHLDGNRLALLVHSGSRGLGKSVIFEYTGKKGGAGTDLSDEAGQAYWEGHNRASSGRRRIGLSLPNASCRDWGRRPSRFVIFRTTFCSRPCGRANPSGCTAKALRPSDRGVLVIPGSRGAWSYLVEPGGNGETSAFSLAHGAGRKWERSGCRGRLERHYSVKQLGTTELGGHVICADRDLLYEEAPQVYKKIETVIDAMATRGLIHVIATFRPLLTYKIGRHRTG